MKLSEREHARLARTLIERCGGLDESARSCRVQKSVLSGYQTPGSGAFMPADVIADLELHCGDPIYTGAMFGRFGETVTNPDDLRNAACALTEAGAALQAEVRKCLADGRLSPREVEKIAAAERAAEENLDRLKGARRAAEMALGEPGLRAV